MGQTEKEKKENERLERTLKIRQGREGGGLSHS